MFFGFNTNVCGKDATFHVQTEDRGQKNPVIDSVIYVGGKVVERFRTSYVPQQKSAEEIEAMVRKQHRELVESIRSGVLAPSLQQPEPASVPTVSGYSVKLTNQSDVGRDGHLTFEFAVLNKGQGEPARGASLDVKWLPAEGEASKAAVTTGDDGKAVVCFPIPENGSEVALLVLVKGNQGRELLKYRIRETSEDPLSYKQGDESDRPGNRR